MGFGAGGGVTCEGSEGGSDQMGMGVEAVHRTSTEEIFR